MRTSGYIATLDGWRAIAIILVIGAHSVPNLEKLGNPVAAVAARFFSHAGYGVDVFFSLSGFLICTLLLREKERLEGRIDLRRFYIRRAFRILPPLLVYLAVVELLSLKGQVLDVSFTELIASLGFYRNYASGSWYTAHFWSLAIEEQYYLLIPFLLSFLRWSSALTAALCLSVASSVCRAIEHQYPVVDQLMPWTLPQFRTENRFDALMNGTILAMLLFRPHIRGRFHTILTLKSMGVLLLATICSLVFLDSQPARRTIVAAVLPCFIAFTVIRPENFVARILEIRWLRWVGVLSYSLYLWQQLFLLGLPQPVTGLLGQWQSSSFAVVLAFACAIISYYCVEKPMISLGHRYAKSPQIIELAAQ